MFSFMANTLGHFYKNFQGFTYCSVFKVLCCFATARLIYHSFSFLSTAFFVFISEHSALSQRTLSVVFCVVDVRSTKLDIVSLRFANDLALSSNFASGSFSLSCFRSPAGLLDTGDLSLVCQFTEADSANSVFSQHRMGTSADIAAGVSSGRELRFALLF